MHGHVGGPHNLDHGMDGGGQQTKKTIPLFRIECGVDMLLERRGRSRAEPPFPDPRGDTIPNRTGERTIPEGRGEDSPRLR